MNRFDSSLSLRGLFSGENRKPTLILLAAPLALTVWRCYLAGGLFPAPPGAPTGNRQGTVGNELRSPSVSRLKILFARKNF